MFLGRVGLLALLVMCLGMSPQAYDQEVLYWCVPVGDGEWIPTYGDDCAHPQIPAYPYPIHVGSLATDGRDPSLVAEATRDAVGAWNSWLGAELFVLESDLNRVDILVWATYSDDPNDLGLADLFTSAGQQIAIGWVYGSYDAGVVAHEIGHLIGLRHDGNPWSVMFPYRTGMSELAAAEAVDLELLRSWYSLD